MDLVAARLPGSARTAWVCILRLAPLPAAGLFRVVVRLRRRRPWRHGNHARARSDRSQRGLARRWTLGQSGNRLWPRREGFAVRRIPSPVAPACSFYGTNSVDYYIEGKVTTLRTRPMTDTQLVVPAPPPPSPGAERMRRHRRRRQKGMRSLMIDVRETENRCVNTSRAARSW